MARPRKPSAPDKKTASKQSTAKAKQPPGLFRKTFQRNLKGALPGQTDSEIILKTIWSLPTQMVRDALAAAGPKHRAHVFQAVPDVLVRRLIDHEPPIVIGPLKQPPPPPPPAPPGGPPADILTTNYLNVPADFVAQHPDDWNTKLTDGQTLHDWPGSDWFEWSPVYDPSSRFEMEGGLENPVVGLTGWALPQVDPKHPSDTSSLSQGDIWFTHPWWYDWEYYIAPDPQYEGLLAPDGANTGVVGDNKEPDYILPTDTAYNQLKLPVPRGVLGVEIDQDLLPEPFRQNVRLGTRIATFGRWIVDTGHGDFHAEIHPPLLIATANVDPPPAGVVGASEVTHVELMSRPFFPSQIYPEGNFIDHLAEEVIKVDTAICGFPLSTRVEAHPSIYDLPYAGRPFIELFVKPPVPRSTEVFLSQTLMVNFKFNVRSGVAVAVYDAGYDTVGIIIVLGTMTPAPKPPNHNYTVSWDELGTEYEIGVDLSAILANILIAPDPAALFILNRGILTDRYDPPSAVSSADFVNVAGPMPLADINSSMGWATADDQPFPISGWLKCWWVEQSIVASPLPVGPSKE
jgi:hypothetical protein